MLLILPVRGGVMIPPDVQTWGLLLALAAVSTVLPIFMFMIGIQRLGASKAAILSTVEPIGTLILATLILGETTQPVQLLGGALILSSVILLQLGDRRADPAISPAVGD
jgi:drug/metabolite transporter (DMT)-like permease